MTVIKHMDNNKFQVLFSNMLKSYLVTISVSVVVLDGASNDKLYFGLMVRGQIEVNALDYMLNFFISKDRTIKIVSF